MRKSLILGFQFDDSGTDPSPLLRTTDYSKLPTEVKTN